MVRYITIDFDWELRKPFERLVFVLRLMQVCRELECHIAKTKKGYHVYIKIDSYSWEKALALRTYLLDDPMRIEFDWMRHSRGIDHWTETLFIAKRQREYEYQEKIVSINELINQVI